MSNLWHRSFYRFQEVVLTHSKCIKTMSREEILEALKPQLFNLSFASQVWTILISAILLLLPLNYLPKESIEA